MYTKQLGMGDAAPAADTKTLRERLTSDPVTTVSAIALTYHGYKRTGSLIWALIYGLAGRTIPLAAVPISVAQGFGERKPCP